MTFVKICGITNVEDALLAAGFGADSLGFNFYTPSPRYLTPDAAGEMIRQLPANIQKVGVFVDHGLDEIIDIVKISGLDAIQLHGDETRDFVAEVRRRTGSITIKAVAVTPHFQLSDVLSYQADAILVDRYSTTERGGTGQVTDWEVAKTIATTGCKLYLAGGLTPENVADGINAVKPFAVDACSCLEMNKGKKDPAKLRAFIEKAKRGFTRYGSVTEA